MSALALVALFVGLTYWSRKVGVARTYCYMEKTLVNNVAKLAGVTLEKVGGLFEFKGRRQMVVLTESGLLQQRMMHLKRPLAEMDDEFADLIYQPPLSMVSSSRMTEQKENRG